MFTQFILTTRILRRSAKVVTFKSKVFLDLELAPEDKQGALAFNEEFQKEIN